jgi:hypothetical protein
VLVPETAQHLTALHRQDGLILVKPQNGSSDGCGKLEGKYANYFKVGHNAYEFFLDFGQYNTGEEARFHTRINTSPAYAQALLETLTESIRQYVERFGEIQVSSEEDCLDGVRSPAEKE